MTTKQQTPIKAHFQSLLLVSTGPVGGDPVTVTVLFSFKPTFLVNLNDWIKNKRNFIIHRFVLYSMKQLIL